MRRNGMILAGLILASASVQAVEPVPLADFARHMRFGDVQISPDGKYIAAMARIDGQRSLSLINLADNKAVNIRPRENAQVIQLWWVGPQRVMYTIGEAVGGLELPMPNGELHVVNADGSGNDLLFGYRAGAGTTGTRIQRKEGEYASAWLLDKLRDDDNSALITVRPWNLSRVAVAGSDGLFAEARRINLRDGKTRVVATAPLRIAEFVTDHDGVVRFAYGDDVTQKRKVYYREGDDKPWEQLVDEVSSSGRVSPIMFNRAGTAVYFSCGGVCRWDVATRKMETIWSANGDDLIELVMTLDERDAFAVRSMPGRAAVSLLDKAAPEAKLLVELMKQFPGEDVRIASRSKDGNKIVLEVASDLNPGTFHLYDVANRKLTALLARASWLKPDDLATMEPISLQARDGTPLHGYISKPVGKEEAKNLPLVVLVHGGPYGVRDDWGYVRTVQVLTSRGYAVLQVNFRGSGGYGYAFEKAGYHEWGGRMQDDITDATKWAIAEGIADPERICIAGTSYGGYAALQGAVREPELYRCTIGDSGIYDLRLMKSRGDIPQSAFGSGYLDMVLGRDDALLAQRSPVNQVERIKADVMLIVGGQDKRVPPVQGETMRNALLKRGKNVEWLYQRTEAHGFYDEANVTDMYGKMLAFLDRNIGAGSKHDAVADEAAAAAAKD